jgi:hypothetical protein
MVNFLPHLLYPQVKNLWYALNRRLGGPKADLVIFEA